MILSTATIAIIGLVDLTRVTNRIRLVRDASGMTQADLARAGIRPFAWVIEQSLLASGTRDPLLALRGECEIPYIRSVADELAVRCALVPWRAEAPVGQVELRRLIDS